MSTPSVYRHLGVSKRGNVTVIRFGVHRILNDAAIDVIGDELYGVAERPDCRKLLLDFTGVDRLSSVMLGKLLMIKKKMQSKGGKLTLCDISPEIREVFKTTNLDQILDIRENEVDGLKALG
jgi:anti-sigma B factor antagonist